MADWTDFRFNGDGSKVCAGTVSGIVVGDVQVGGDAVTLSIANIVTVSGFTGTPIHARWYNATDLVFLTTTGVWSVASPWTTPTLLAAISNGVRVAGGNSQWAVELPGPNGFAGSSVQTSGAGSFTYLNARYPDMSSAGALTFLKDDLTEVLYATAVGAAPSLFALVSTVFYQRVNPLAVLWTQFTGSVGATFGTKLAGGGATALNVQSQSEIVPIPIAKGSALWVASILGNVSIILRPWGTLPSVNFQAVVTASQLSTPDAVWDGTSKFRVGWVDAGGQFHGLVVTPMLTDEGAVIGTGGGSGSTGGTGGGTGGSSGGGTGSGVGRGVTVPGSLTKFVRQSAPLIPHLSAIPPGPARQATKVLYDRLNELEKTSAAQIKDLNTQLGAANTTIASMQTQITDNKVAADSFFGAPSIQNDISNASRSQPPDPTEPPGGGGGGSGPPSTPPPDDQRVYVQQTAEQFPAELAAASSGNDTWLRHLLQVLRTHDTRWGRNINPSGALSMDKLAYYYGDDSTSREGSTDTYTYDCISGLGGSNNWSFNLVATGVARWTSNGEF